MVVSADGSNRVDTFLNTKRCNFKIRVQRMSLPVDAHTQSNNKKKHIKSYDRNIRIKHIVTHGDQKEEYVRRSKRIRVPVKKYNCAVIQCFQCKKKIRGDISIEHYSGNTVCSKECLQKSNESQNGGN